MNRPLRLSLLAAVSLNLSALPAEAGPCSKDIASFEEAVRQSAGDPNAGPVAPESIGAQLSHQPTARSIKRAERRAQAAFDATLARAKRLDARGDRSGCTKALIEAKRMYELN
jgi:hypothetical protein